MVLVPKSKLSMQRPIKVGSVALTALETLEALDAATCLPVSALQLNCGAFELAGMLALAGSLGVSFSCLGAVWVLTSGQVTGVSGRVDGSFCRCGGCLR